MDKKKKNILKILTKIQKNKNKSVSNSKTILNFDTSKSNLVLPINSENNNKKIIEIISLQLNTLAKKYKMLENNIKDNNITIKELISDNVSKHNSLNKDIDDLKKSITIFAKIGKKVFGERKKREKIRKKEKKKRKRRKREDEKSSKTIGKVDYGVYLLIIIQLITVALLYK